MRNCSTELLALPSIGIWDSIPIGQTSRCLSRATSEAAGPVTEAVSEVMKDVEGYSAAAMKAAVDAVPDDSKEKVSDQTHSNLWA